MKLSKNKIFYGIFLGGWSIWLASMLFTPISFDISAPRNFNLVPLATIIDNIKHFSRGGMRQLVGNTALFVPIGFGVKRIFPNLFKRGFWGALAFCVAVPVCIEFVQMVICPARSFDVDDIILNGLRLGAGMWGAGFVAAKMKDK